MDRGACQATVHGVTESDTTECLSHLRHTCRSWQAVLWIVTLHSLKHCCAWNIFLLPTDMLVRYLSLACKQLFISTDRNSFAGGGKVVHLCTFLWTYISLWIFLCWKNFPTWKQDLIGHILVFVWCWWYLFECCVFLICLMECSRKVEILFFNLSTKLCRVLPREPQI